MEMGTRRKSCFTLSLSVRGFLSRRTNNDAVAFMKNDKRSRRIDYHKNGWFYGTKLVVKDVLVYTNVIQL